MTACRLQEFSNESLQKYFDQSALLIPVETIVEKVTERDFQFFLSQKNFYKVADTLQKFQDELVDLDSQAGRDFIVFKRQLYQLFEVQNRSVDEHEAFSMRVERENLKWIYQSSLTFQRDVQAQNDNQDLADHATLKGAIFKAPALKQNWINGAAFFATSGLLYSYFPFVAAYLGYSLTSLATLGSSLAGLYSLQERSAINSIAFVKEGEHAGKLQFNISQSTLASKDYIVSLADAQTVATFTGENGENDLERNVFHLKNAVDASSGETVAEVMAYLPRDGAKDFNTLDWLSQAKFGSEADAEFHDLMVQRFEQRAATGGLGSLAHIGRQTNLVRSEQGTSVDSQIDNNDPSVDQNIQAMRELLGAETLEKMSSTEFYNAYKQFASEKANF